MHILVSNDDGYLAQGLLTLVDALKSCAQVTVVAPDKNRSAASNSLTLDLPLRAHVCDNGFIRVDGTPTDCVHLAISGLLAQQPDMVIAGINHGANLGDDVIYSGTVAAATEGRFLGFPAMAISLVAHDPEHFATAAHVAVELTQRLVEYPLAQDTLLNVNVPDIPLSQLKGYQITRLGQRHKSEAIIRAYDQRGRDIYWIGPPGDEQDAGFGTDFYAIKSGFVSITPLQLDLSHYTQMETLKTWLSQPCR
jgi:5'-nucleotidase